MIDCDLDWNCGWGNEVIQYCFGRCLAAELDYYVKCPKIRYLDNSGDWNLEGKRFHDPVYEISEKNHKHRVEVEDLRRQTDCKFIVRSFLEYYPFYKNYSNEIKNDWMYMDQPFSRDNLKGLTFKIINWDHEEIKKGKRYDDKYYTDVSQEYPRYPDGWHIVDKNGHRPTSSTPFRVGDDRFTEIHTPKIHEDDLLLNIRLGPDYTYGQFRNRRVLSDYFLPLLDKIHFKSLFICSEWPFHEILQPLYKYNPIFLSHSNPPETKTFNFIRLFNKVAITQSSWSWMAAYLSEATEIYFPITRDGPWSYGPNQKSQWKDVGHDLMVDEDRYIYVNSDGDIIGNYDETRKKLPFPL